MGLNPLGFVFFGVFTVANIVLIVGSFRYAFTGVDNDAPNKPSNLSGRGAALFVALFSLFGVICSVQVMFLGRIAWLPFGSMIFGK